MSRPAPRSSEELLRHAGWVRALAGHLVRDPGAADDLAQEALLAAVEKPPPAGRPLGAWLARVLRNLSANLHRERRRRREREAAVARGGGGADAGDVVRRAEAQRRLVRHVLALDEPYRSTLLLHYFEGRSAADIARDSGEPAGTVRWRLARGRALLRASLGDGPDSREWRLCVTPLLLVGRRPAAVVTGGAVATATGAALMTKKVLLAAVLLLLLGGTVALVPVRSHSREPSPRAPGPSRSAAERAGAAEPRGVAAEDEPERTARRAAAGATSGEHAAPPGEVALRFVDGEGRPVGGVRLTSGYREIAGEVRSDGDGCVETPVVLRHGAIEGRVRFTASGAGVVPKSFDAIVRSGEAARLGDVVLERGGAVVGRVVDDRGAPVPRVLVTPANGVGWKSPGSPIGSGGWYEVRKPDATRTDANGLFRLEGVPPGRAQLSGYRPGYRAGYSEIVEVPTGGEVRAPDLTVVPVSDESVVEGRVLDPEGRPVHLARVAMPYVRGGRVGKVLHATDEDGWFLALVPDEAGTEIPLGVSDPARRYGSVVVTAHRGDRRLEIRLPRQPRVELVVRDDAGDPVERYAVVVHDEHSIAGVYWSCLEDDRPGGTLFVPVPDGPCRIVVRGPWLRPARVSLPAGAAARGRVEVTVSDPRTTVEGRVSARGAPVGGARVWSLTPRSTPLVTEEGLFTLVDRDSGSAVGTDAEGRFRVSLDGSRFVLRVGAPGFATALVGPFEGGPPASPIEIELTPGGTIDGRVRASDGPAGPGVVVTAANGDGILRSVRTGESGVYRFDHLAPGAWRVRVTRREWLSGEEITGATEAPGEVLPDCVSSRGRRPATTSGSRPRSPSPSRAGSC